MKSLVLTMQQGVLYTCLTYTTMETWLPHSKYSSHGQHAKWYVDSALLHIYAKTKPTTICTSHMIAKYVPETNMPVKWGTCSIHAKYLTHIYRMYAHIFTKYISHWH